MPAAVKQIGLGLGVLALVAVGGAIALQRSGAQSRAGSAADVAKFRGAKPSPPQAEEKVEDTEKVGDAEAPAPIPAANSVPALERPSLEPTIPPLTISPCEPVFSPDGRYVACRQPSSNRDGASELYVFDAQTGKWLTRTQSQSDVSVELFWPKPEQMVLAGVWGQTWNVNRGHALPGQMYSSPAEFAMPSNVSPGMEQTAEAAVLVTNIAPQYGLGVRMISDRRDETVGSRFVEIFDTKTGNRQALFQPDEYSPADVSPFLWSPQGKARLLVSEYSDDFELQASLWDAKTGHQLWSNTFSGFNIHLEWTPDGRYIMATRVTGSRGRDPFPQHLSLLIDARNGHVLRKFKVQNSLLGTAVSNKYLASFGYEKKPGQNFYSRSWALTNLQTGKRALRCWVKDSPPRVEDLAISPDNRLIVGTSSRGIMLWKVAALRQGKDKPKVLAAPLTLAR